MVRVLVSTRPYVGHLHPVLPVLEALVATGHQVVVATADELALTVENRGLGWCPAGVHPDRWLDEHPADDANYGVGVVGRKTVDLLAALSEIGADLVLADATDLAATIAAPVAGKPLVRYSVCHYLSTATWRPRAVRTLRALRRTHDLPPDPGLASFAMTPYLDVMPPALQLPDVAELAAHHVVRFEPRDLGEPITWAVAARPRVLVSFGTVFGDRPRLWRAVAGACARLDVEVVDTRTDRLPLTPALASSRVLVCHGGFNTVLAAVASGTPMLCLPMAGDQYVNAEIVHRSGLGIRLSAARTTQREIADAVTALLADPSYATRIAAVRASLAELPAPSTAVPLLEQLAGGQPPSG